MQILIVEDDAEVAEAVEMTFSMRWQDSDARICPTGGEALATIGKIPVDLVILDVNLPDMDGFSILDGIRKVSSVPIIMLTVRGSETDKVRGLERGADDYLSKPFSPLELLARASAVLRRSTGGEARSDQGKLIAGPITINLDTTDVEVEGRTVKLTPTEFKILTVLAESAGKVVTRNTLLERVWGTKPEGGDDYLIKLHIQHLRRKFGDDGAQPHLIQTVRGFGYKLPA